MRIRRLAVSAISVLVCSVSLAAAADLTSSNKCSKITDEEARKSACACVADRVDPPNIAAYLEQPIGSVVTFGPSGSHQVEEKEVAPLVLGDGARIGSKSSALLKMGSCERVVGPNATMVIRELNSDCACAALLQRDPGALFVPIGGGAVIGSFLLPVSP